MQDVDTDITVLVEGGRFIRRDAILFDFAEGLYGFWWGEGPHVWNGISFAGAGRLLELDMISVGSDGSPTEMSVTLNAMANTGLTPDVLSTIESYTYHQRPVRVYRFYYDPVTRAQVGAGPRVLFAGIVDQFEHVDQADGAFSLVGTLVSKAVDYRKAGYLKRGVESQKLLNNGNTDLFFEQAAQAGTVTSKWGEG